MRTVFVHLMKVNGVQIYNIGPQWLPLYGRNKKQISKYLFSNIMEKTSIK